MNRAIPAPSRWRHRSFQPLPLATSRGDMKFFLRGPEPAGRIETVDSGKRRFSHKWQLIHGYPRILLRRL